MFLVLRKRWILGSSEDGMEVPLVALAARMTRWAIVGRRSHPKKHDKPYLLSYSYEINLLASSTQNCLGLCYITLLINCHCQTHGENAVSSTTVNLAFRRLQPKYKK